jgi:hypothetical protein
MDLDETVNCLLPQDVSMMNDRLEQYREGPGSSSRDFELSHKREGPSDQGDRGAGASTSHGQQTESP